MIEWSDEQLSAAGIDKARLKALVRKLTACGTEMTALGLHMYGESGNGNLIHKSVTTHDCSGRANHQSVVATADSGSWDGGGW